MKKPLDKLPEQYSLHDKIVREILPNFAERLKKESVISAYDRHPFKIPLVENRPPIRIIPDLVMYLPNGEKVLVEIANPRESKRFVGEIVYPYILGYYKKIAKAIIFVLHDREHQKIHDRAFALKTMLNEIFGGASTFMASWPPDEITAYHNLKIRLKRFLNQMKT